MKICEGDNNSEKNATKLSRYQNAFLIGMYDLKDMFIIFNVILNDKRTMCIDTS